MSSEQQYFTMFYEDDADAATVIDPELEQAMDRYLSALLRRDAAQEELFTAENDGQHHQRLYRLDLAAQAIELWRNRIVALMPHCQWINYGGAWFGVDSDQHADEPTTYNLYVYQQEARPSFVLEHKAWGGTY